MQRVQRLLECTDMDGYVERGKAHTQLIHLHLGYVHLGYFHHLPQPLGNHNLERRLYMLHRPSMQPSQDCMMLKGLVPRVLPQHFFFLLHAVHLFHNLSGYWNLSRPPFQRKKPDWARMWNLIRFLPQRKNFDLIWIWLKI